MYVLEYHDNQAVN